MNKFIATFFLLVATQSLFAAEHIVEMKNSGADGVMVFEPAVVKAEVGDTVRFVGTDVGHNSESVNGLIPAGAEAWKGAINEEVSITLTDEGVYVYQCLPHVALTMVGVIVAGEPNNLADIKANSTELSSKFMVSQDRLSNYLEQVK